MNEAVSDTLAERIAKTTNEKEYTKSNVSLDNGRYIIVPVRKNIEYQYDIVRDNDNLEQKIVTKKLTELNFYEGTYRLSDLIYKPLSWAQNPYNKYEITTTISSNSSSTTEKNLTYFIINVSGDDYELKLTAKMEESLLGMS